MPIVRGNAQVVDPKKHYESRHLPERKLTLDTLSHYCVTEKALKKEETGVNINNVACLNEREKSALVPHILRY